MPQRERLAVSHHRISARIRLNAKTESVVRRRAVTKERHPVVCRNAGCPLSTKKGGTHTQYPRVRIAEWVREQGKDGNGCQAEQSRSRTSSRMFPPHTEKHDGTEKHGRTADKSEFGQAPRYSLKGDFTSSANCA